MTSNGDLYLCRHFCMLRHGLLIPAVNVDWMLVKLSKLTFDWDNLHSLKNHWTNSPRSTTDLCKRI